MATQKQLTALKKARAAKAKKTTKRKTTKKTPKKTTSAKKKTTTKRTSKLSGTPEKYEIMYKEKTGKQWTSKNYVTTKASVKMYLEQFLADFDYNKNFSVIKITKPKS